MKYRKRLTPIPGFRINLSRSGASATVGVPGLSVNVGRKGAYLNTGLPGTGLYDRKKISSWNSGSGRPSSGTKPSPHSGNRAPATSIGGNPLIEGAPEALHDSSFDELRETMMEVYHRRQELFQEIDKARRKLKSAQNLRSVLRFFLIGFLMPFLTSKVRSRKEELDALEEELNSAVVDLESTLAEELREDYEALTRAFELMSRSALLADITGQRWSANGARKAPVLTLQSQRVSLNLKSIPLLKTNVAAMHFENADGHDLYVYPGFILLTDTWRDVAIVKTSDFALTCSHHDMVWTGSLPSDAEIVGQEWAYANKDGSPDRRYRDNFLTPKIRLARLKFSSSAGLSEEYLTSHYKAAVLFTNAWNIWYGNAEVIEHEVP